MIMVVDRHHTTKPKPTRAKRKRKVEADRSMKQEDPMAEDMFG